MLRPVLPITTPLALFDAVQTRAAERQAAASLPPHTLMRRAGESVARLALAIAPHAERVWIACGPGNNGGDGLEAAVQLLRAGKQVEVSLLANAAALPADAADALRRAQAAGVVIQAAPSPTERPQLAIDALLGVSIGVGAGRAPSGALAASIRALNALPCPLLAVDLPSGLHAATGQLIGTEGVTATHTLALLTLKPGLFTGAGRDHAGQIWLDQLGVDASPEPPLAWLSGPVERPPRRHAQHKGSFGDVVVVGGAAGMAGAAWLAARAAHAAGAGRVYVDLLDTSQGAARLDPVRPEIMFRGHAPAVAANTTVVCGCGGGDAVRAPLPRLLSVAHRLVLDADALNALAADPALQTLLRRRTARGAATVLTPHPLEAARLLGVTTGDVQADRLHAAQDIADRFGCVVVLKGSGSVIAAPGETPRINSTGNAALATAGTGDVLAGWLGGRWAGCPRGLETPIAFTIAQHAVGDHGAAAEPAPDGALRAGDLIERLCAH